ncbi:MAG TPA: hypothetical protein VK207_09020 [Bacteroidales bacterium]|nr:hypothetical protein [Bacteroidales bacterium]
MGINGYSTRTGKENFRENKLFNYENDFSSAYDIPSIIEDLKQEQSWLEGELSSVILLNSPSVKVLLTILHGGTEVISYQANDSITFQIIEGSLILHIKEESVVLEKGELMTLTDNVKYSFDAVEETAFLMTLVSKE